MSHTNPGRAENYTDEDITFFMGLYRDRARAVGALRRLREHFPGARVIVRSDGDPDPMNRELADPFGVDYREEERLFPIEHGGAMVARTLELLLEKPTPYLLRIDTDTAVYRRFRFLPGDDGVFGNIQVSVQGCESIQGGCTGFTEAAARSIFESGLLGDARLKDPFSFRHESVYFERIGRRVQRTGLSSFDWIVGWAVKELALPLIQFDEVHCRAFIENSVANDDLKFAVTHPVYFD
jgi:hypothetical protein